jgi:hypothetical protein
MMRGIQSGRDNPMKKKYPFSIIFTIFVGLAACSPPPDEPSAPKHITSDDWNVATRQVVAQYSPNVKTRLKPHFKRAGVSYPPQAIELLAFKKERKVELWAKDKNLWHYIRHYPIAASSGHLGPKLMEDDEQIPEGIYKIQFLHPFSRLHLSMKLNYPNDFDRLHAEIDGREELGDDIYIHGKALSVGCLAIGDRNIEDLFVLVNDVGTQNVEVIIAPHDLRQKKTLITKDQQPEWVPELYEKLQYALGNYSRSA